MAMAVAPVTVVQPLMRLSNIFGVLFAWYMNRDHEVFDRSVLSAIGLSMLGAAALGIESSLLIQWLGLPASIAGPLLWHWPS
jgi:hypothetical protein